MLETDHDVYNGDDIMKSFMKEHDDINKQIEESWFSFKFVGS